VAPELQSLKNTICSAKNDCYPAPLFYMQELDYRAIYCWNELVKLKNRTCQYMFLFGKVITFEHCPYFAKTKTVKR